MRVIGFAAATLIATHTSAQSRAPSDAVVRLSSGKTESDHACGSGFFIEKGSAIMTNAHIATLLCKGASCPGIRIEQDRGGGRFESALAEERVDLHVRILLPSIDLAVLELPSGLSSPFSLNFSTTPISVGMAVTTIGFPQCAGRFESKGAISDLTTISFLSGTKGASGSSGGPAINEAGEVVGVVFQADSLLRTVYDSLGKGSYALRAVRTDLFAALTSSHPEGLRGAEAEVLLRFYSADIKDLGGLARLKRGLQFLNAARMLGLSIAREPASPEALRGIAALDGSPDGLLRLSTAPPNTPEGRSLELLSFVANVESRGTRGGLLQTLTPESFAAALQAQGRPSDQIQRFLSFFPDRSTPVTPGVAPLLALLGSALALGTIAVLLLWAASLGYVYARARGGRLSRILRTVVVAIAIWPLSFIAFRFLSSQPTKKLAGKKSSK